MEYLYAPWRSAYTGDVRSKESNVTADESVFCRKFNDGIDEQHFVLRRFKHVIVLLNLYPYNAGHLLIMPLAHCAALDDLDAETQTEMMWLTSKSSRILQDVLGAEGINIGLNLGKAAGAGVPSHLHMHVLPRWEGDSNFLPLLAETKQISFDLNKIYAKLKPAFDELEAA